MVAEAIYALRNHNGGINSDRRTAEAAPFAKGIGADGAISRGEEQKKELADKAKERADEARRLADIRKDLSESLASDLLSTQETAKLEKERADAIQQINASTMPNRWCSRRATTPRALATGTLELRIATEGACLIVACTPTADGYAADLTALDTLSPRARRASLWMRRTGGWEHLGDLTLIITGGC